MDSNNKLSNNEKNKNINYKNYIDKSIEKNGSVSEDKSDQIITNKNKNNNRNESNNLIHKISLSPLNGLIYERQESEFENINHFIENYIFESCIYNDGFIKYDKVKNVNDNKSYIIKKLQLMKNIEYLGYRELDIMIKLLNEDKNHNNHIIQLLEYQRVLSFDNNVYFEFIYDFYDKNLSDIINDNNKLGFNLSIIKNIAKQLLTAIINLHKNNIKHINLNTNNIQIKKCCFKSINKINYLPKNALYNNEDIKSDKNDNILLKLNMNDKKYLYQKIVYKKIIDIDVCINSAYILLLYHEINIYTILIINYINLYF